METRSKSKQLIVKNVEMLLNCTNPNSKEKVKNWLMNNSLYLSTNITPQNQQQQSAPRLNSNPDEFFDSTDTSSINTARYILSNRKTKRKSSVQCRSKIKKFRESSMDELEMQGEKEQAPESQTNKFKDLTIENIEKEQLLGKSCSVELQNIKPHESKLIGT
ncbi:unnamed protein product [Diamesa tonsa]